MVSPRPPVVSRRSFVERLSLGAGAVLLSPIASSLVSQARGQPQARKRFIVHLLAEGIHGSNVAPPEHADLKVAVSGARGFTLPTALEPLAPHRDRLLIIDGMHNRTSGQHTAGYGALSGFGPTFGSAEGGGSPGGPTIDQFIAEHLSASFPHKSILWGVSPPTTNLASRIFAAGRNKPLMHHAGPEGLWKRLFGRLGANAATVGTRQRVVFDSIRVELGRLEAALAVSERRKLDHYLEVIEDFERRQKAFAKLECEVPAAPAAPTAASGRRTAEESIKLMNEMATLAVACGLSAVVGTEIGCGYVHQSINLRTLPSHDGHGPNYVQNTRVIQRWYYENVVLRSIEVLSRIKEGDRSLFDNAVVLVTSDNGDHHHAGSNWPLFTVGNAGGGLKADGRFFRYARMSRPTVDLFATLAAALDVPGAEKFAEGVPEKRQGPVAGLL